MRPSIQLTKRIPLPSPLVHRFGKAPLLVLITSAFFACAAAAVAQTDNTHFGDGALGSNTEGDDNSAFGVNALFSNTVGSSNTAIGIEALFSNTAGSENTASGNAALRSNTTGSTNTASGSYALFSNTSGGENTASGRSSLYTNTTGDANTATGALSLSFNTTGERNTAHGGHALYSNTSGGENTAAGYAALLSNTIGSENTANGYTALSLNTTGDRNAATGRSALYHNSTGSQNTADGYLALLSNTTGHHNTAAGSSALAANTGGLFNTAAGSGALFANTTGDNNIALGYKAGENLTTGSDNIVIGTAGIAGESNAIRIGKPGTQKKAFIQGISGVTVANGVHVVVAPSGKLGVATSSREFKEDIKPMENASEALLALKPVTFQYKHDLDPESIPQFGLVAEEVEKVNPDLVARDENGKVFTVRYEAVNAMLLNEFLKEHAKVGELQANAIEQQNAIQSLTGLVKQQSLQIEKLTVRIGLAEPAPQVGANQE